MTTTMIPKCAKLLGPLRILCINVKNISPFLNTCFYEGIVQVLRNQGGGEGGVRLNITP